MGTNRQGGGAEGRRRPGRRGAGLGLLALLLAPAASASHPSQLYERPMNLDGDRTLERLVAEYDVSSDHTQERADVTAFDRCNGREIGHKLVRTGKRLSATDIFGPRALGRPAVLFSVGYGGRTAVGRVMGLRRRPGQTCPLPYAFFAYSTSRPPKPPPPGLVVRNFSLLPRDEAKRYPGPELRLLEFYGRNTGDQVSKRETYFRFRNGRYLAYRSKLSPA